MSGQGTWSARCAETCTSGAAGGPGFPQSSGELKGLRDKPVDRHALWAVLVLGFAGAGRVVLLGGGIQELACDGGIADGDGVVDAEHGGEGEGVGAAGKGFFELPVAARALEGGSEAAACRGQPVLADRSGGHGGVLGADPVPAGGARA